MGIRINTNVASLYGQRNLTMTQTTLTETFERLSSGLRINRSSDDVTGIAIAEKLRTQIKGYSQAIHNAQDGINLIQATEGAVTETVSILQRMRELVIEAANDSHTHDDRVKIQEEVVHLREELTHLAQSTQFNSRFLLDGSSTASRMERGPNIALKENFRVGDTASAATNIREFVVASSVKDTIALMTNSIDVDNAFQLRLVALQGNTSTGLPFTSGTPAIQQIGLQIWSSAQDSPMLLTGGVTTMTLSNLTADAFGRATVVLTLTDLGTTFANGTNSLGLATIQVNVGSLGFEDVGKAALVHVTARQRAVKEDNSLIFHVGPNPGQIIRVGLDELTAKGLRLQDVSVLADSSVPSANADIADFMRAQEAIGVIDVALDQVNGLRSRLGASQNRLESTIRSLDVSHENLTSTESRIRDADIAKETAALTRAQILVQTGTAMLAQANVNTQSVLALLR